LEEKLRTCLQDQQILKNSLSQKEALLLHLKSQIKKVETEIIDIPYFKKQVLEVNDGL
jgi:hypothetical protein